MKKLTYTLAFTLLASPLFAQGDAKAKTVLDNLSKSVSALKSLKTNFTLSLASANGKTRDKKTGSLEMKGNKYHVVLGPQEIFCDGRTVWTYLKDAGEVQVTNFSASEQTLSPTKLFTNFYDKEYTYRYAGAKTVNGKAANVVELSPKTVKQFKKVELAVDAKANNLIGGTITEKNGTVYQYAVSGYTPNAPVSDAMFTFDPKKYKGVEVVDLR
ncbi:MAG: outer membrane lipoprotein carrier protein LolA [Sphingobacteriales bacterium]|nr:MAG: outer membrane lipoprotein carrier protein LolA [Sphingobacteriales bacterium]